MNVAAGPELAAAVSNAGGLGVIGGLGYTYVFCCFRVSPARKPKSACIRVTGQGRRADVPVPSTCAAPSASLKQRSNRPICVRYRNSSHSATLQPLIPLEFDARCRSQRN